MRQDNVVAIRRRNFVVTTDSDHRFRVQPGIALTSDGYQPALGGGPHLFAARAGVRLRALQALRRDHQTLHTKKGKPVARLSYASSLSFSHLFISGSRELIIKVNIDAVCEQTINNFSQW